MDIACISHVLETLTNPHGGSLKRCNALYYHPRRIREGSAYKSIVTHLETLPPKNNNELPPSKCTMMYLIN